jgi:hypothetical protein
LQQSVNLGNVEAWSDLPLTGNLNQPGGKRVLLEAANLNSVQRNFLRMFKQAPIGP